MLKVFPGCTATRRLERTAQWVNKPQHLLPAMNALKHITCLQYLNYTHPKTTPQSPHPASQRRCIPLRRAGSPVTGMPDMAESTRVVTLPAPTLFMDVIHWGGPTSKTTNHAIVYTTTYQNAHWHAILPTAEQLWSFNQCQQRYITCHTAYHPYQSACMSWIQPCNKLPAFQDAQVQPCTAYNSSTPARWQSLPTTT